MSKAAAAEKKIPVAGTKPIEVDLETKLELLGGVRSRESIKQLLEVSVGNSQAQPGALGEIDKLLKKIEDRAAGSGKIALTTEEIVLVKHGAQQVLTAATAIALIKLFAPNDFG